MAGEDEVELIPKIQTLDLRFNVRGNDKSGVANVRMQVSMDTPSFVLDFRGKEYAASIAKLIRDKLSERYAEGKDAQGKALPRLAKSTIERRERRQRQHAGVTARKAMPREIQQERRSLVDTGLEKSTDLGFDDTGALAERLKLRGRSPGKGGPYSPSGGQVPLNESGLFADNVQVTYKGRDSGDPVFLISIPSGGKTRGLTNDDGRGARLFAAQHYGFSRLLDIPRDLDQQIDSMLEAHLMDALKAGGSSLRKYAQVAKRVQELAEQGARGESEEI